MGQRKTAITEANQDRALNFLLDLAKKADRSDDAVAECFMDAEAVIDAYQAAVEEKSSNIPSAENIGVACFWLLSLTQTFVPGPHFDLVLRFLSPGSGISLYGSLDAVLALRQHAVSALGDSLIQPEDPVPHADTPPFEDLF